MRKEKRQKLVITFANLSERKNDRRAGIPILIRLSLLRHLATSLWESPSPFLSIQMKAYQQNAFPADNIHPSVLNPPKYFK
jgi:hypothetical protein